MTAVIKYFTYQTGANPVKDFINSLEKKQKIKIFHIFNIIVKYGIKSIPQHVKKLSGIPLWEIRILGKDNIRIIYFIQQKETIMLLHGFIKKSQKTDPKDISIALKRFHSST